MKRLQYSLYTAAGILLLAMILTAIGPKRVLAALGYTPVRDVDNGARRPFMTELNVRIDGGHIDGSATFMVPGLPTSKRLVIEAVTASATTPLGQGAHLIVFSTAGGSPGRNFYPLTFQGEIAQGGELQYDASFATRIYADGGSTFNVILERTGALSNQAVVGLVTLNGYLVDLP